jgi:CMP-2-keto-3-deoxyoctulosonic acid synthetase
MNVFVNTNELSSAVCDLVDVKETLSNKIKKMPKDNEGSEITIGDCLEDVLSFLHSLEAQVPNNQTQTKDERINETLATLEAATTLVYNIEGDRWQMAYEVLEALLANLKIETPREIK